MYFLFLTSSKTDYEGQGKLKHLRHGQQPEGRPGIHGEPTRKFLFVLFLYYEVRIYLTSVPFRFLISLFRQKLCSPSVLGVRFYQHLYLLVPSCTIKFNGKYHLIFFKHIFFLKRAGFSFARGHFVIQVPYDQYEPMVFQGEEIFMGLRGWSYGYDYYTSEISVAFHMYAIKENKDKRKKVKLFWVCIISCIASFLCMCVCFCFFAHRSSLNSVLFYSILIRKKSQTSNPVCIIIQNSFLLYFLEN